MNQSTRRLVLHMGMGKTGSSALQVAFVRLRDQLGKCGVNYPTHASDAAAMNGRVVSGNGMGVIEAFAPRTHSEAEALRSKREVFDETAKAEFHTTLYSSEFLYSFSRERVESMQRELAERGVRLQAVVFVRNMAGHAVSSYSQAVKRTLYTGTFRDYIDRSSGGPYRPTIRPKLNRLLGALGADNLHVLHYDSVRDRLVECFFGEVLGVDVAGLEFERASERINRSLTRDEVALMRYMNGSLTGRKHAHLLSDVMIEQPPLGTASPSIRPDDLEFLREFYDNDMDWVNDVFFPETRPLAVAADDVPVASNESDELEMSLRESYLLGCLVDLAQRHVR